MFHSITILNFKKCSFWLYNALLCCMEETKVTAILKQTLLQDECPEKCSTLGSQSVFCNITFHLSLFSTWRNIHFVSECSTMLHDRKTCNCHSQMTSVTRFNVWHNVPLLALSLNFIGLLPIIIFHLMKISFLLMCSIMLYGQKTCNCHSKTSL
jgi:uncharacterized membrane protein YiaA